tara:strand:- start:643 stop:1137 length:495 start_codon:yes stop_codon:yes gene_type:complete
MWSPCFNFTHSQLCKLCNYRRSFSIWSVFARGTPEKPGLGFALESEPGGFCEGVVFTLPLDTKREDLIPLWEREMWTETYDPVWVTVEVDNERLTALTFVVSTEHPQYAGDLPTIEKADYIAKASGKYGTCYDYLFQTVSELRRLNVQDTAMEELLSAVDRLMG